ncbi:MULTISPECIES: DUF4365 domain-containing protein [Rhizobium]|uniref:DUF4365 domain-containing protein n=1 Tax=Rhizobium miluonense TaxID=411945 RepID=A0A1C3X316_9HYPH|nr:DUF4365 domain-containing protein [Rhizobium miluonense]SCB46629.1 protein of unknown function [Rhizobium miluonense]
MVRLLRAGFIAIDALIAAVRRWIFPPPPLQLRGKKLHDHETDPAVRLAIDAVEKVFLRDFKWAFRRLSSSDTGIDARAEILDDGRPTGRFLPLQIRSVSPTSRRHGDHTHRGEKKNLDYWTRHSLPVWVIIVDSESGLMLWQQVEERLCEVTDAEWSIVIPATNVLDASARLCFEETIATDPESLMRSAFALDHALMQEIRDQTTFFVWDEWGDTTAIFCNLRIYIGEGREEEPDVRIDYHLRAHSLHDVMTTLFPWATYSYAEPISEYSGEVAVHILEVELRPGAYAYLEAESFLEAGYPEDEEPSAPEPDGFITEEEEREFWQRRRRSRRPDNRTD